MNYVVIDLEMCKVPKLYRRNYKHANETIQIGDKVIVAVGREMEEKEVEVVHVDKKT